MEITPDTTLYFDTNALRALKFYPEIALILEACRAGEVKVKLSEWVIFEYARQQFKHQTGITGSVELIKKRHGKPEKDILRAFYILYKEVFSSYGVEIIGHDDAVMQSAKNIASADNTYFSHTNDNDWRDALILASGLSVLTPDSAIVICEEKKLGQEFYQKGFKVADNAKDFFAENIKVRTAQKIITPDIVNILNKGTEGDFSDSFHEALMDFDPTYSKLFLSPEPVHTGIGLALDEADHLLAKMGDDDDAVRRGILSFVHWASPIPKDILFILLEKRQFSIELIDSNVKRLVAAQSVRDTGTHFIPGVDGLCEAIGNSRIEDAAELLG